MSTKKTKRGKILKIGFICFCVIILIVFIFVAAKYFYSILSAPSSKKTDIYKDYVIADPNLTWSDENAEFAYIHYFHSTDHGGAYIYYYELEDLDKDRFLAAKADPVLLFTGMEHNVILVKPEDNFSPWKDWTVKDITLYSQDGRQIKFDSEATKELTSYLPGVSERIMQIPSPWDENYDTETTNTSAGESESQITENTEITTSDQTEITTSDQTEDTTSDQTETQADNQPSPNGKEWTTQGFTLQVRFNETDNVVWKAEIVVWQYEVSIHLMTLSSTYRSYTEKETIPEDSKAYSYILEAAEKIKATNTH